MVLSDKELAFLTALRANGWSEPVISRVRMKGRDDALSLAGISNLKVVRAHREIPWPATAVTMPGAALNRVSVSWLLYEGIPMLVRSRGMQDLDELPDSLTPVAIKDGA